MRKEYLLIATGILLTLATGLLSCNSGAETSKTQKIVDSLVQRQTFVADSISLSFKTVIDSLNQAHKATVDSIINSKEPGNTKSSKTKK